MSDSHFDWVDFYKEFAEKLLLFKDNRKELIAKVGAIYRNTGISKPTLEKGELVDIDPFTVFGLFNKSSMKQANRIAIIEEVAKLFDVKAEIPATFESVPVLNNQNATFYLFKDKREEHDINDLWALFCYALDYTKKPSTENRKKISSIFDKVINCKGNGTSKITMGLYWIAPNVFLNLDSRNKWYIFDSGMIPESFVGILPKVEAKVSSSVYFDLVDKLHSFLPNKETGINNFLELSSTAWKYSQKVNNEKKKAKEVAERGNSVMGDGDVPSIHYWLYSPGKNSCMWDEFYKKGIMALEWDIGDLSNYSSKEGMKQELKNRTGSSSSLINITHAIWQFSTTMRIGDIVFVKKGLHQIVGKGIVSSDYFYDPNEETDYVNVRKADGTHCGAWEHPDQVAAKTLTDITPYSDYLKKLSSLFEEDDADDLEIETEDLFPTYTETEFLEDVFLTDIRYQTLTDLIRRKKNVILEGAPGVGKTYCAKRIAYSMMGVKDPNRVSIVQFHQSYSYEDFIMGLRPSEAGKFELRKGIFYNFCKDAEVDSDNDYFFIIDEINRGNLSKIFGELFMLLEGDKRGVEIQLLYSDEKFLVPSNVYIIGTMNTADRSLAMMDYALRRRFGFFDLVPAFESEGFMAYRNGLSNPKFDRLISRVESLNTEIAADNSLGEGFCIGHSYFCNLKSVDDMDLNRIVEFELVPLLKEYWFDEPQKVKDWAVSLRSSIH